MTGKTPAATTVSRSEIEDAVLDAVATGLELEREAVSLDTPLVALGAESLDFLDITFTIERRFGIQMPRVNLLTRVTEHFGEDAFVKDSVITPRGLDLLRAGMPEVPPETFHPEMRPRNLIEVITPATLARVAGRIIAVKETLPTQCPECGDKLELSKLTPEAICSTCDTSVPMPSGDDVMMADMIRLVEQQSASS